MVADDNAGHRERIISRLSSVESGSSAMQSYELLEILLFFVNKRKDTKGIAKALIKRFSTIEKILFANEDELLSVEGIGGQSVLLFKIMREVFIRSQREKLQLKHQLISTDKTVAYCRVAMANLKSEQFRAIYLNRKNYIMLDEFIQNGSIDSINLNVRDVIYKGLSIGASALLLVHNHPSGDPRPSFSDISTTIALKETAGRLNMELHDHIIISHSGYYSMREEGDI